MKIGFITDSTCDLPYNVIVSNNVHILPIKIKSNSKTILDDKSIEKTKEVRELFDKKEKLSSDSCTPDEIKDFIVNIFKNNDYNYLLCIMPMSSRSNSYNNTLLALPKVINEVRDYRKQNNNKDLFEIEIIDSTQLSTGTGVILADAIKSNHKELSFSEIVKKTKNLLPLVQTYVIPQTLSQLYTNGSSKGDGSVGLGTFLLGSAFDIKPIVYLNQNKTESVAKIRGFDNALDKLLNMIIFQIKSKTLLKSHVNISYGGSLRALMDNPKYKELEKTAEQNNIFITLSNMSSSIVVNVGEGAISVAFVSNELIKDFT